MEKIQGEWSLSVTEETFIPYRDLIESMGYYIFYSAKKARNLLDSLGYTPFVLFYNGTSVVRGTRMAESHFDTLHEFIQAHFEKPKSYTQIQIEKLEIQASGLQSQIQKLKQIQQGE